MAENYKPAMRDLSELHKRSIDMLQIAYNTMFVANERKD